MILGISLISSLVLSLACLFVSPNLLYGFSRLHKLFGVGLF
ncbi:putative membrane protein [Helicobacter pylori Hp H-42]|uniref:Membrane protein n=1 Tax=Helicobacter pylori Hp H-42 TaxID=992047 RepID=A0AB33XHA6_HELPX|nr:putative membrane protein [Helicobacter pylori Hp H-42]